MEQVVEQPRTEFHVHAVGGVGEDVGAQAAERDLEQHGDAEPGRHDAQGRQALMDEHFVHHHLEEQRRRQAEELQGEADHKHFTKDPPIAHDRAEEPGQAERTIGIVELQAALHQHQRAVPPLQEGFRRQGLGPPTRVLHQHPFQLPFAVYRRARKDKGPTVSVECHRRQWRMGEA